MKFRFSIFALLGVTTTFGLWCLWRCQPKKVADQFVQAVAVGDYSRADSLFSRNDDAFLAEFMARDDRNRVRAHVPQQSVADWLLGTCRLDLELVDAHGLGAELSVTIPVDAAGLKSHQYLGGSSGITGFFDSEINKAR